MLLMIDDVIITSRTEHTSLAAASPSTELTRCDTVSRCSVAVAARLPTVQERQHIVAQPL